MIWLWAKSRGVFLSNVHSVDTVTDAGTANEACKPVQSSLPQGYPLPGPSCKVPAGAPLRGERLGTPADGGTLRGHLQPPELPRHFRWVLRHLTMAVHHCDLWKYQSWRTWAEFQIFCWDEEHECIYDLWVHHLTLSLSSLIVITEEESLPLARFISCSVTPAWIKILNHRTKYIYWLNTKCWKCSTRDCDFSKMAIKTAHIAADLPPVPVEALCTLFCMFHWCVSCAEEAPSHYSCGRHASN